MDSGSTHEKEGGARGYRLYPSRSCGPGMTVAGEEKTSIALHVSSFGNGVCEKFQLQLTENDSQKDSEIIQ